MLTLAVVGVFTVSVLAQTTEEGKGPSEQPSAPMEIGQPQSAPAPPPGQPGQAGRRRNPDNRRVDRPSRDSRRRWEKKVSRLGLRAKVRLRLTRALAGSA